MEELTNKEQLNERISVVEVYSPVCALCKKQAKIIETLSPEFTEIKFFKCSSESEIGSDLCTQYDLMKAPSLLVFHKGMITAKYAGLIIPNNLKQILTETQKQWM